MATKIVDRMLPTTMVGSDPRPHWFDYQLLGRDVRIAVRLHRTAMRRRSPTRPSR
jgi:hypothetical protein